MSKEEERLIAYRRSVGLLIVAAVFIVSFLIVRPFIVAILSAAVLAFVFYPLYKYFLNIFSKSKFQEVFSAMLTSLIIILIVLVPVIVITIMLTKEVREGYVYWQRILASPNFNFDLPPEIVRRWGDISQYKELFTGIAGSIIDWVQGVLKAIPNAFLNLFVTIFSTYYFLKHGEDLYKFFRNVLPLPEGKYEKIIARFDDLSRGVILGQVVVGAIQGVLAWIAFVIVAVPNPILWGFLTFIISIIPMLGAAIVWVPICLYLFIKGYYIGSLWRAIFLLLYGTLVISTIDNILKPKIVGDRARIHPLVVLFGILGGIQLFGLPGVLIGPLVLTLFDVMIEIYKEIL